MEQLAVLGDQHEDQRDVETAQKPAASGVIVPSKSWPIAAPITPPPSVCMKPCTDDAVPATWPSGSMAIELKFDPIQPNCSIAAANSGTKT